MANAKKAALTAERVNALLAYNATTGVLTWKVNRRCGKAKAGDVAGHVMTNKGTNKPYRYVCVDGKLYRAHRLIKFMVDGKWPDYEVDHRDTDSLNNAWTNLRDATHEQNMHNAKLSVRNKSGYKGVCWHKKCGKWIAQITVKGKNIFLGYFTDVLLAAATYAKAAAHYFGSFMNLGVAAQPLAMAA